MNIEYIEFTSPGLVRSVNQDSIFSVTEKEYGLFVVADGMGGHTGGEIASQRLISALQNWWNEFCTELYDFDRCYDELRSVINDVHKSIFDEFTDKGEICGTTIALVFIYSDRYIIINSGDSRIYSKNGLKLKQESVDHVFGIESVISGTMTAEDAKNNPNKNKLTAGVGCKKELKIYIASAPLKANCFFICSDGVYKYCKRSDIKSAMRKKDITEYISEKVNNNGAADNFSFICVKLNDKKTKANALAAKLVLAAACFVMLIGILAATVKFPESGDIDDQTQSTTTTATTATTVTTTETLTEERSTEGDPDIPDEANKDLDEAYKALKNKEFGKALDLFSKILENDAENEDAYIGLAESYIRLGEFDKAINKINELAALDNIESAATPEETVTTKETEPATETTTTAKAANEWNETEINKTMYITKECNSRKKPIKGAEIVSQYKKGAKVQVVAITDTSYYKISDGSFIHSVYLTSEKPEVTSEKPVTNKETEPAEETTPAAKSPDVPDSGEPDKTTEENTGTTPAPEDDDSSEMNDNQNSGSDTDKTPEENKGNNSPEDDKTPSGGADPSEEPADKTFGHERGITASSSDDTALDSGFTP